MKILHFSDPHLTQPGKRLHGTFPGTRLRHCLDHAAQHHADAACLILSGDLTDAGAPQAYQTLQDCLRGRPWPVHLMLGNHDDRAAFHQAWPTQPALGHAAYVQQTVITPEGALLLLDTLDPGQVSGHLCDERLAWLDKELSRLHDTPACLFMHHPPFMTGMGSLDECRLDNPDALLAVLQRHGKVRHIFCGHVHRHISGSWHGIPFSTIKGTNHQTALCLGQVEHALSAEAPGYGVILLSGSTLVVHYQDI